MHLPFLNKVVANRTFSLERKGSRVEVKHMTREALHIYRAKLTAHEVSIFSNDLAKICSPHMLFEEPMAYFREIPSIWIAYSEHKYTYMYVVILTYTSPTVHTSVL